MAEMVKVIKVICVSTKIGVGTDADPIRDAIEYWDEKGNLLFVLDAIETRVESFEPNLYRRKLPKGRG